MEILTNFFTTWKLTVILIVSRAGLLTYGLNGLEGFSSFLSSSSDVVAKKVLCNDPAALDNCLEKIIQRKSNGIPTTNKDINIACKLFHSGMKCVNNWTNVCLIKQDQEEIKSSIIGALDTYQFLCTDKGFQRNFLRHSNCYKKISLYWDDCARKFIGSLKRVNHANDILSRCCIRLRYLQCVSNLASHFCSKNATIFIQQLATSLIHSTQPSYHPSQCSFISDTNCGLRSTSQASTSFSFMHRLIFFLEEQVTVFVDVLLYSTIDIINTIALLH